MQSDIDNSTLSARDLEVGWNFRTVAQVERLDLEAGQILVMAGPNGAGKSTVVRALARQIQPLSGQVLLNGRDVWQMPQREFARQVAYVPQVIQLLQDLTVRDLVRLGRNPHQAWWSWQASDVDEEAVRRALERTSTIELSDRYVGSLSGGERQRAVIAMALAQDARFILLDEPTAHLDFRHQLEVAALLRELRSQGLGVLAVLHDLDLMSRVADDVLLLKAQPDVPYGTTAAYGPATEILVQSLLQRVFSVDVRIVPDPDTGARHYVLQELPPGS